MKASLIPGMVEAAEQELLHDLAAHANLAGQAVVCEFGAYFGRSTKCLADGLLDNSALAVRRSATPVLRTYDVFACDRHGVLGQFVRRDAEQAGLEHLLREDDAHVDFSAVFDHCLSDVPPGLMARQQIDIASARHSGEPIALMHLDAPKWYAEYLQVLREFGPHLRPGAQVIFQDYFYHWSGGVIAAVELMFAAGLIRAQEAAASSLLVKVLEPLTLDALDGIHQSYAASDACELIGRSIDRLEGFELDRQSHFLPRLYLAAMQISGERGDYQGSREWLARLRRRFGKALSPTAAIDLKDLVTHGFSLRRLYELDITPQRQLTER